MPLFYRIARCNKHDNLFHVAYIQAPAHPYETVQVGFQEKRRPRSPQFICYLHKLMRCCCQLSQILIRQSSCKMCSEPTLLRNANLYLLPITGSILRMILVNAINHSLMQTTFTPSAITINHFPHTTIHQQTTLTICCQKIENLYN